MPRNKSKAKKRASKRNTLPRAKLAPRISSAVLPARVGMTFRNRRPTPYVLDGGLGWDHAEFLGVFNGIPSESITTYKLNPGDANTFPDWLSPMALMFESYLFDSITVHLIPTLGTSAVGMCGACFDYNIEGVAPVSQRAFIGFEDAAIGPQSFNLTLSATPQNLHKRKTYFCRGTNSVATNATDTGRLLISTGSNSVTTGVFEAFIEYRIRFFTPRTTDVSAVAAGGAINASTGVTKDIPFGTAPTIDSGGINLKADTSGDLCSPTKTGTYLCSALGVGTGVAFTPPGGTGWSVTLIDSIVNGAGTEILALMECTYNGYMAATASGGSYLTGTNVWDLLSWASSWAASTTLASTAVQFAMSPLLSLTTAEKRNFFPSSDVVPISPVRAQTTPKDGSDLLVAHHSCKKRFVSGVDQGETRKLTIETDGDDSEERDVIVLPPVLTLSGKSRKI